MTATFASANSRSVNRVVQRFGLQLDRVAGRRDRRRLSELVEQAHAGETVIIAKAGTPMAKETASIELFYDRVSLAPTGVVIREKNGNRTVARIAKAVVNGEAKAEDRKLLDIPSPDPKEWTIDERPWKKPE